jgi:hypothetical protein
MVDRDSVAGNKVTSDALVKAVKPHTLAAAKVVGRFTKVRMNRPPPRGIQA